MVDGLGNWSRVGDSGILDLKLSGDTYVNYNMIKSMTKISYVKCIIEMDLLNRTSS